MHVVVVAGRVLAIGLVGAVLGIASVAVHDLTPGLLLGLAATAATAVALPGGWTRRLPFAAGWSLVVVRAAIPRGSGSYLVAANPRGYALVLGAVALLVVAVLTAVRRPVRPIAESGFDEPIS